MFCSDLFQNDTIGERDFTSENSGDLTNQAGRFLFFSGGIMVDCVATRVITVDTFTYFQA